MRLSQVSSRMTVLQVPDEIELTPAEKKALKLSKAVETKKRRASLRTPYDLTRAVITHDLGIPSEIWSQDRRFRDLHTSLMLAYLGVIEVNGVRRRVETGKPWVP